MHFRCFLFLSCSLLFDFLYLLSSEESDSLNYGSDELGSDSRSSVTYSFCPFLCILTVPLVVLVFLSLEFLHQQESGPKVIFFVWCVCTNRSRVQRWLTHRNVLALKFLIFFPNLKLVLIVIVIDRLCLTHSNLCSFTKNMISHAPMGTIRRPLGSGSGGTDATDFIQCINGRYPQIN